MARPADPNAHDSLVKAARAAFARHGLVGARIEDITRACGLSKGAFYLHFASKEALFEEVVTTLLAEMTRFTDGRLAAMRRFFVDHGPVSSADIARHTARYEALIELETRLDVQLLELLWDYRDVLAVLLRGSQGTRFQTLIWEMADLEVTRVAGHFAHFQDTRACREDVPAHVFGTVMVGTYLLVVQQMVSAPEKPDLRALTQAIHRLIREGSIGHARSVAPGRRATGASRPARRSAPARTQKASRTRRKS